MLLPCADHQAPPAVRSEYECKALTATSADGIAVPITLAYKKGAGRPSPLLLTAYGAYGMCADTSFKPERVSLLKRG